MDDDDDDEELEATVAPVGSRVQLNTGEAGCVRSISPGGSRMCMALDGVDDEIWIDADGGWTLLEPEPSNEADDEPPEKDDSPMLENWRWTSDGAVEGYVYGKSGYRDGELMTTSIVPLAGRFADQLARWPAA